MSHVVDALRGAFQSQLFGGGLALMVVGAIMALARSVPARFVGFLKRRLTVTLDIPSGSRVFDALVEWLDQQPYSRRSKWLTVADGKLVGTALFTPAPGHHVLWLHGRPVWLNRERKEVSTPGSEWARFRETLTVTMLGRSQEMARRIVQEALDFVLAEERTVGFFVARYEEWTRITTSKMRPLDSVILPAGLRDDVVSTVDRFLGEREWYDDRGMPWTLKFLFDGPPGTGKTSCIKALAGHFGIDLYHCGLASRGMSDERLIVLLNNMPERSALLLEDIDRVVSDETVEGEKGGVTFSGLLNALDGVGTRPGLIVFMTTNNPDRLNEALTRPGRVDHRHTFPLADAEQGRKLFLHFYGAAARPEVALRFGQLVSGLSPAAIQRLMKDHRDDPRTAVAAATEGHPAQRQTALAAA